MVAALLDDSLDEVRGAAAVANRLMYRLRLMDDVRDADVVNYETVVESAPTEGLNARTLQEALRVEAHEVERADRLLQQFVDALLDTIQERDRRFQHFLAQFHNSPNFRPANTAFG